MRFLSCFIIVLALGCCQALAGDLTGKVVGPDGKAVTDATVYCLEYQGKGSAPKRDAPTTRSDDTGTFHFQADGNGELAATKEGVGFGMIQNTIVNPRIEIHLIAPTDVTLTFTTTDKKPVAGLPVSLQGVFVPGPGNMNFWLPESCRSPWSATTDSNGICTFKGLPQNGQARFSISDERFANLTYRDQVMLSSGPKTQADPIQVYPAATLSGKLTYGSSGRPAAGISVVAQANDSSQIVTTGADGTYIVKQLQPGQYTVALQPNQELAKTWTAKAVQNVGVAAGDQKTGVDLTLIPGVIVSGTVVAGDDGSGVAGVTLGIYSAAHPRDGGFLDQVNTDANGKFSLHVPAGEEVVLIMSDTPADGFGRPSPDNKTVTIADGGTATVEFRLPRVLSSPIKGKVVDQDGNPVGGALVYVASDQVPMLQNNSVTANADGTFQTMSMVRTGRIEIRAKLNDMATPKAVIVTRNSPGSITVQLQKGGLGAISGRVVDAQGQPLKGARIELITQSAHYSMGSDVGMTDDKGAYKADSLWADGQYLIEANCNGYGEANSAQLHVEAGQTSSIRDLTLYKRDSTVAGVLLDADNKPVAGQRIFINGPRTGPNNLTTDNAGKFNCTVVSGDRLTIFYNLGRGYNRQPVRSGDQNIVLHTSPARAAPVPVLTARPPQPAVVASAQPAVATAAPVPPAVVYNPADAVTWYGWVYAAVLLVVGGAITVIANAFASLRHRHA